MSEDAKPETKTPPTPAEAPANFKALQASHPAEAALLQTVVTQAVSNVEHHLGDLPGTRKRELAEQEAVDLLKRVYDGADLWFGFNPAIDLLARECLIPLIPKAIAGIVRLFNQSGVFSPVARGVE